LLAFIDPIMMKIRIPSIILVAEAIVSLVVVSVLLRWIQPQIGWDTYKIVGASTEALKMWKSWQTYLVLLKWLCMTLPFNYFDTGIIAGVLNTTGSILWVMVIAFYGVGVVICAGLFGCIWISHYACKTESGVWMGVVICFYFLAAAAMIAQVIYLQIGLNVTITWGLMVIWILMLVYHGFKVKSNYGKGMKIYFQNETQALQRNKGTIRPRKQQLDDDDDDIV